MRPKEWLVKNGHLPAGSENARGRISAANIELLKAAVAGGVSIEGYSVSVPKSSNSTPKVERVAVSSGVTENPEETVPERYNVAMVGDTVIGNRTVCNVCHRSLNFHICESPTVMYNGAPSVVRFKSRKDPESYRPNRWW